MQWYRYRMVSTQSIEHTSGAHGFLDECTTTRTRGSFNHYVAVLAGRPLVWWWFGLAHARIWWCASAHHHCDSIFMSGQDQQCIMPCRIHTHIQAHPARAGVHNLCIVCYGGCFGGLDGVSAQLAIAGCCLINWIALLVSSWECVGDARWCRLWWCHGGGGSFKT